MESRGIFSDYIATVNKTVALVPESDTGNDNVQQSRDWFRRRLGMFTASKADELMTQGKGEPWGKTSLAVVRQVYLERTLTPEGIELYIDELMYKEFRQTGWGNRWEPVAREKLAKIIGPIDYADSVVNKDMPFFSGSADGKCQGVPVEIKNPYNILVHDDNLAMDVIGQKNQYYGQIQSHIMNAGSGGCWFASHDPRRAEPFDMRYWMVERDDAYIARLTERLWQAEEMVQNMIRNSVAL